MLHIRRGRDNNLCLRERTLNSLVDVYSAHQIPMLRQGVDYRVEIQAVTAVNKSEKDIQELCGMEHLRANKVYADSGLFFVLRRI